MNVQISPPPSTAETRPDEEGSHTRTYIVGGAALLLALGGFWYFTHGTETAKPKKNLTAPVHVALAETRTMAVVEKTIGTVVANSTVSVNARIQGQMVKAFFKEGQLVRVGDPLFQIDPRPYQATYDNALASLATAKAKAERFTRLKAQSAIAAQDYDDAQASFLEAKANAEMARLNLEFTLIRAPVNGKTGAMLIQPGNMVAAATASTSATPLVTINEIQPVKISMALPQSDLPRIQAMQKKGGLSITINMHDVGGDDLVAPVDFISNAVTNTTGTIELRANYANKDMALVPGQLVDVTIGLANIPDATVVPREAINTGPDGQFLYVVNNGAAEQRMVKVLFDDGTNDAISGPVKAGEQVIVDGQLRVVPGAKVNVTGQKKAKGTVKDGVVTSGRHHVKHAQDNEG